MALKIIKAMKKQVSVKNLIHSRLAGWEKPRSHSKIHASDLMRDLEFCPRELALLDLGKGKKRDQYIGTALRITFDHGRDVEYRIRNDWLRDIAVGTWKCGVCGTLHSTFGKVPTNKCGTCSYERWEYEETRFSSEKTGVSGGIDLILDVGEPKLRIVEIKTIDKDEFKKLQAPLAEHRFRTSLYLRLAEEESADFSERVNTKEANIIYVTKSFGFKDEELSKDGIKDSPFSPFKEFVVQRDDSLSAIPLAKAEVVTAWRADQSVGMPCGVCVNGLSGRAQKCPVVSACFSGEYPQEVTWLEGTSPRHEGKKLL